MKKKNKNKKLKKLKKALKVKEVVINGGHCIPAGVYYANLQDGWLENTATGDIFVLEFAVDFITEVFPDERIH
jgi:hypothetical protein